MSRAQRQLEPHRSKPGADPVKSRGTPQHLLSHFLFPRQFQSTRSHPMHEWPQPSAPSWPFSGADLLPHLAP